MAKYVIKKEDLPPISAESPSYAVRFRLVTENRNRFSSWSPIYNIFPNFVYQTGSIDASKSGGQVSVVWSPVSILKNGIEVGKLTEYDIWVNWYKHSNASGDWIYQQRVLGTNTNLLIPSTYYSNGVNQNVAPDRLLIEIYAKGNPITRDFSDLRLYNPPAINI